ncbi:MAG: ADP-ribosylglycohydrolase [Firmicutes bacterium HGW-Firmicutes-20]|jgi:ADP-ribosylglycohydrolase|nr:MAG: ADP-ribosylglycohydrolase [Firmicutes bacterium HGW-Firmicutes-20]PKM67618.1 MAG: ADP-ribosylglycohydrolase [Firmicutes bacterium HGW-Firmicutes-19]
MTNIKDRAQGAFIGALIGEALGVGPHWFYDLNELKEKYGEWIDDYTEPQPDRYHAGLKPGELSQQGWIIQKMAEYLISQKGYDQKTFEEMIDKEILPQLDGTPMGGKGGYTSQVMRHLYQKRIIEDSPWGQVASNSDTTESLERNIPMAVYFAADLNKLSHIVASNTALTQADDIVGSLSVAFNLVLAMLIRGHKLDENLSGKLMRKVHKKEIPFHAVTTGNLQAPKKGEPAPSNAGQFASPDALLSPSYMAMAAKDPSIIIEPAWKASLVYGMPCAIYHMLPAAYYLAARFDDDFESGVLHAINGGGQNQVRAMLTGALIGAQVGLSSIPQRFIDGLKDKDLLLDIAEKLTENLSLTDK